MQQMDLSLEQLMFQHLQGNAYCYNKPGNCQETIKQQVNEFLFHAFGKLETNMIEQLLTQW